jgi:hypothetical protein
MDMHSRAEFLYYFLKNHCAGLVINFRSHVNTVLNLHISQKNETFLE